ncbi:hypothetical protein Esi_0104_0093 [Ectocarpus siliculosus]|uniref:DUF4042 domain-containing protein n=1 Tax=Ectocarpus siliculosus TaxID=2880 RepID=D7FH12_ECTSI|nr:hypothetical protein Esi_0104_0093 [Ectocarpus siliculosus]|eukprot:CBJ28390.1 hypothetical protein Esi_0104_0093 [Ectocarpus siliculosus]
MPGERRPHRWAGGSSAGSSTPPSSSRRTNSAASSPGSRKQQQQGQQQQRWGSSLSTQRRERTVVWASCLRKVQALRQGGSWQRAESGGTPAGAGAGAAAVSPSDDGILAHGGRASGDRAGAGTAAFPARPEQLDGAELNEQLGILARLTYPNSSISPQDAGFMLSALCEAVPRSSRGLSARVAQLFELLCAKQQRVSFLAWQLNIVLDLFVASLPSAAAEVQVAPPPPPPAPAEEDSPPPPRPPRPLSGQRDCTRALAQLLYENGERLGTRFDDVVPPLLRLADPSAIDLDTRHAALDALANLCLKNWAGFAEQQRQAICSCLTRNFVAHWARVRLQALALLESMAAKDAKSMYPHWALFFAPYVPGAVSGGGACGGDAAAATPGEVSEGGGGSTRPVVLPAGLVSIMESDHAPQVSPLRKWMMLAAATRGGGGGGGGIGERVESMMLRLHRSLVLCLAQEKSPAVVAKLCSCTGALIAEMPYATSQAASGAPPHPPPRGGGSSSGARRGSRRGGGGGNSGGGGGVEESLGDLLRELARLMVDVAAEPSARIAASQALTAVFSTKEPIAAIDSFLLSFRCSAAGGLPSSCRGSWGGSRATPPPSSPASAARRGNGANAVAGSGAWSPLPLRPGSADDRGNRFVGGVARNGGVKQQQQQQEQQDKQPSPPGERASGGGGGGDSSNSSWSNGGGGTGGAYVGGRAGGGLRASDREGVRASDQMPPPLPREATVDDDTAPAAAAATAAAAAGLASASEGANGRGDGVDGGGSDSFVDRLIALAGAPGQLRAEALGLLTRIGRSYPAHLSGGCTARGTVAEKTTATTWERVSALLLRCFADPDQNLRLHALKVLEALLLARAEQAAAAAEALPVAGEKSSGTAGGAAPAAESVSPKQKPRSETAAAAGGLSAEGVAATGGGGGGSGGKVWRDLVQKHLQRALEDPYHGVRAVACSCHASLLKSDWEAFSDRERERCLGRVLAATRDRAAGVNILACRVVAGVMTMAGQEGAAAWCRDPEFLHRCAARLQEMMEDTKPPPPPPPPEGTRDCQVSPAAGTGAGTGDLIPRPRLRSLCDGALRLTATEPDHAAGSAVRALGYLAWGLDPDNFGGGGDGWGGKDGVVKARERDNESAVPLLPVGGDEDDAVASGRTVEAAAAAAVGRPVQERGGEGFGESGEEDGGDRDLQDKAILALSTRLAPDKGDRELGNYGAGGGGGSGGGDRRAEIAGAKCRSEPLLVELLHRPWDCPVREGGASEGREGPVGARAHAVLREARAVLDDNHLKVRTHAAHALKAVLDARAYGDQLPSILGGCLRGLAACKSRSVVADPTQMRYAGDLEVALRSLVLHILIALVALGDDASSSASAGKPGGAADCGGGGGGPSAALLGEYADELLEVLSSPESDAALSPSELSPYYRPRPRRRRLPIEDFQSVARGIPHQDGRNQQDEMTSARFQLVEPQQRPGGPSPRLITEAVLAATAEGLTCLLGGAGAGGRRRHRGDHHGGNGARGNGEEGVVAGSSGDCGGRGGGGEEVATELSSSLVSKQTWAACVAEAGRRRLRVDRLLGGGKNSTRSGSSEGGIVWEAEDGPGRVRVVTAAMAEGGGGGRREEEEEEEEEEEL